MGEGNNPQYHKEYLANKFDLPTTFAQFYLTVYRIGMGGWSWHFPHLTLHPYYTTGFCFCQEGIFIFLLCSVVAREIKNNGAVSLKTDICIMQVIYVMFLYKFTQGFCSLFAINGKQASNPNSVYSSGITRNFIEVFLHLVNHVPRDSSTNMGQILHVFAINISCLN